MISSNLMDKPGKTVRGSDPFNNLDDKMKTKYRNRSVFDKDYDGIYYPG